eukprot:132682_1
MNNIKCQIRNNKKSNNDKCLHNFSSSPNGLPQYIVSKLFYSTKKLDEINADAKQLERLLSGKALCIHCVNTLLSIVSLDYIINYYIKYAKKIPYAVLCITEILVSVFAHSKIPKILAIAFTMDQQLYDKEMKLMAHAQATTGRILMH